MRIDSLVSQDDLSLLYPTIESDLSIDINVHTMKSKGVLHVRVAQFPLHSSDAKLQSDNSKTIIILPHSCHMV